MAYFANCILCAFHKIGTFQMSHFYEVRNVHYVKFMLLFHKATFNISESQHSPVDPSAPTILCPQVRSPSTTSMVLIFKFELWWDKTKIIKKEAWIGSIFVKKTFTMSSSLHWCNQLKLQNMLSVKCVDDIYETDDAVKFWYPHDKSVTRKNRQKSTKVAQKWFH